MRLRAVTLWGHDLLATRDFRPGESVSFDLPGLTFPRPDGVAHAAPLRARAGGWALFPEGASEGRAWLGGVARDLGELTGRSVEGPGDRGILRYGRAALYFEVVELPARLPRSPVDRNFLAAVVFAFVAVGGGLAFVWSVTGRRGPAPPAALLDAKALARVYHLSSAAPVGGATATASVTERGPARAELAASPIAESTSAAAGLEGTEGALRGPAPDRELLRTVLAHQAAAERCYAGEPGAEVGVITLRWVVARNGRTESVEVTRAAPPMPVIERCLVRHIAELSFEKRAVAAKMTHTYRVTAP